MAEARIPNPKAPFVDSKTGIITRDWWRFLHDQFERVGGSGDITGLFSTDIGSSVQAWDVQLDDIAALAVTDSNFIVADGANWVAETGAVARTSLGLGALAIKGTINNGDWSGTDLALVNGGTGASTATAARTALGVVIGTDVFTQRTITAGSTTPGAVGLAVTNGSGVSGNPTITITTSATDSITSGTTQTQVGATALTTRFNRVTTHGNINDGVKLPAAVAGLQCVILNDTATADLQVWPATSDAIEAGAVDAVGVTKIGAGVATTYEAVDGTTWYITNQHTTP